MCKVLPMHSLAWWVVHPHLCRRAVLRQAGIACVGRVGAVLWLAAQTGRRYPRVPAIEATFHRTDQEQWRVFSTVPAVPSWNVSVMHWRKVYLAVVVAGASVAMG